MMENQPPLLSVRGLETQFVTPQGRIHAVNGVSFDLADRETIGVVGESGCGKSVTMLSILRLIPSPPGIITAGSALFHDRDLLTMSAEDLRHVRGAKISMVFQDPMTSFNPLLTIGRQITETLETHLGMTAGQAKKRAAELLDQVGIPRAKDRLNDYPHQFSGGMRQRAMIAMALSCGPEILIADEPTTALDLTIQAQIVDLVKELRQEYGMAIIWITHDLGVIANLAQHVIVMYAGLIIEEAPVGALYRNPRHPYTQGLLGSLSRIDQDLSIQSVSIDGLPPIMKTKPTACPFAPRCKYVIDICRNENPLLESVAPGHRAACWVAPTFERARV